MKPQKWFLKILYKLHIFFYIIANHSSWNTNTQLLSKFPCLYILVSIMLVSWKVLMKDFSLKAHLVLENTEINLIKGFQLHLKSQAFVVCTR